MRAATRLVARLSLVAGVRVAKVREFPEMGTPDPVIDKQLGPIWHLRELKYFAESLDDLARDKLVCARLGKTSSGVSAGRRAMLLFPLSPNSKVPPAGVSWKLTGSEDAAVHREWRANGMNLGYPTGTLNGSVVIDFDDKEKAREFYRGRRAELGTMVETRKGVHFYFRIGDTVVRNSQKKDGYPYDVRGEGGYVVYPDSVVDGWTYKFVRGHGPVELARLPLLKPELIPPMAAHTTVIDDEPMRRVYRARLWIQKVPGAVSGQGGHSATWRVACHLTGRFGLSVTEAMPLLLEWNDTCHPPWSFKELSRKLSQASQEPVK